MSGALARAVGDALGVVVTAAARVRGGQLNEAWRMTLADGSAVFVKTSPDAPGGAFAAEAAGLRWLGEATAAGGLPVPPVRAVLDGPCDGSAVAPRALVLDWLEPGPMDVDAQERLGRGLAATHRAGAERFGGTGDLALGAALLPDAPDPSSAAATDGAVFWAECRLRPLAAQAQARGAIAAGTRAALERIADRAPELTGPPEPPARLHGDLWPGNVLATRDGDVVLIDPAAHGGHREVDLAMLALFARPDRALSAYAEAFPLADGAAERVALWQLAPLLVHAVVFGGVYGARVASAAARFA